MGWLELDKFGDVRLAFQGAWVLAVLSQTVSAQSLEGHLHVVNRVFIVHLVEEKLL